ncbi:hypothetical protein [Candidatus Odyssella acanthamoebae]|uniref:Uncharacterized protein n=1 Tax=Candidatus Odyssella acanthamoebae TaxID=91604 RepID=A0A077AUC3_9PROT|nr:hypothetical protein [Candidatus Paracaedibacter acanthamoebae]AIK95629.1 hypothetical protein ID47_01000 [Candidatus Paracaedibacter acanthamoebae]
MSLLDLATALRNQLPVTGEGSVVLDQQTLTSSNANNVGTILQNIIDYLGVPVGALLTITNLSRSDVIDPSGSSPLIIKAGKTSFFSTNMFVKTLQFTLSNQTLTMVLQTTDLTNTDGTPWTLGTSFFEFLVFPILDQSFSNPSFIFSTTTLPAWPMENHVTEDLQEGLNFYAELNLTDPIFQSIVYFLNFLGVKFNNDSHFFGQIDNKNRIPGFSLNFPNLQLTSPLLSTKDATFFLFDLFTVSNPKFGVRLIPIAEDSENDCPADVTPELYFELDLIVDATTTLDFSVGLKETENFLMFGVRSPKPLSLEHVFILMAGNKWDDLIPSPLQSALSAIDFQGFIATIGIGNSSFTLSSLTVSVGSDPNKPLNLFPPFKDCSFWVTWTILNPTDPSTKTSAINCEAQVEFEKIGIFNVEIAPA